MAGKKYVNAAVRWPVPIFAEVVKTHKNYESNYRGALTYAHYEMTPAELKKEVIRYFKKRNPKDPALEQLKTVEETRVAVIGKYMYILNHGGEIPEGVFNSLMNAAERVVNEEKAKTKKSEKSTSGNAVSTTEKNNEGNRTATVVVSIQDRILAKAREAAAEVEGWIDDFYNDRKTGIKSVEEFVNFFKAQDLKAPHIRHLRNMFEPKVSEYTEAIDGTDKELAEGYSNFTKPELKRLLLFCNNFVKACDMMAAAAKVARAPRQRKPVSQERLVSKLKYMKEDSSLGIVSQSPLDIIGAKELWVYNTKTRKLSRFVADELLGPLSVKGTAIIGQNEVTSITKTLRRPAEQLVEFKKSTKVQLRTFMDKIKAVEIKANSRLNEHTVILKVSK